MNTSVEGCQELELEKDQEEAYGLHNQGQEAPFVG